MEVLELLLAGAVIGSTILTILLLTAPSRYVRETESKGTLVKILVLGDIGRSPRMQYHALSIARHGGAVEIIGYQESEVHPELKMQKLVSIIPIPPPPRVLQTSNRILFLALAPLKVLWQIISIWMILGYQTKASEWLLVQNPPSIPTLVISQIICFLRNTNLLIDWHNFGWSILALKLGPSHPMVRVSKWYEAFFGRNATAHFTVTNAMARILKEEYHITSPILPLHDRPPVHFQPLNEDERASFIARLPETSSISNALESGRSYLLVSSTSWTADEDFSLLLSALVRYSKLAADQTLPHLLIIITGKGPQKQLYLERIAQLGKDGQLSNVTIKTAWLSNADYASLLASASLGISLHTSSSGVDLPMKVVDMFGAGLPVVGWDDFEAWPELVQEGVNGRGFKSEKHLTELLESLFGGNGVELKKLRAGALKEGQRRWDDEWNPLAGKLLGLCT